MWEIDDASVFAQIDAFVQRCRDLIEVCENQMQFVRKTAATKGLPGPLPQFGGTKASEIISSLHTIENSFQQQIDHLRSLDYDVLDVRVARWHDDYHDFKGGHPIPYQHTISTYPVNTLYRHILPTPPSYRLSQPTLLPILSTLSLILSLILLPTLSTRPLTYHINPSSHPPSHPPSQPTLLPTLLPTL